MSATTFVTIDLDAMAGVNGGDGWGNYTKRLGQDATDTKNRYNAMTKNNMFSPNYNPVQQLSDMGGTIFNGAKTVVDSVKGIFTS